MHTNAGKHVQSELGGLGHWVGHPIPVANGAAQERRMGVRLQRAQRLPRPLSVPNLWTTPRGLFNMATTAMASKVAVAASSVARPSRALRAVPLRASRAGRRTVKVQSAVELDFNTKVWPKELVKWVTPRRPTLRV